MPAREVEPVLRLLCERGLVVQAGGRFMLTESGLGQARAVWDMAIQQQDNVFARFTDEQKEAFADMLKQIITGCR